MFTVHVYNQLHIPQEPKVSHQTPSLQCKRLVSRLIARSCLVQGTGKAAKLQNSLTNSCILPAAVPSVKLTESTNTLSNVIFAESESSGRINDAHTCTGFAIPSRNTASGRTRARRTQGATIKYSQKNKCRLSCNDHIHY